MNGYVVEDRVAVTIFGRHRESWMDALGPGAPVWSRCPAVRSVRVLDPILDRGPFPPEVRDERPVLIPLLENHIRARPSGYFVLCPSGYALETLADKGRFAEFAGRHGLEGACPPVYDNPDAAPFPLLAKPTTLNAGNGIRLLADRAQYEEFRNSPLLQEHRYIYQEFIETADDYCSYLFCRKGRVIWHRTYRFPIDAASPIRGPVEHPGEDCTIASAHIAEIEKFLVPLAYSGSCNVDYKIVADSALRILEINPRLGGSLILPDNVADLAQVLRLTIEDGVFEPA